jgi:hypothetical protein
MIGAEPNLITLTAGKIDHVQLGDGNMGCGICIQKEFLQSREEKSEKMPHASAQQQRTLFSIWMVSIA